MTDLFRLTVRDMCLIALFVAIIAAMAQIIVPIPPVPFTLQTFAIPLAGVVLGARRGSFAVIIYLLLGAIGVPVFAGFNGGLHAVMGPTGGFLLSFPIFALIAGLAMKQAQKTEKLRYYLWLVGGLLVGATIMFTAGMLQLAFVTQMGISAAFGIGVLPFIIPDMLKIALVVIIAPKLRQVVDDKSLSV
ncbi:MAG: biotin transporter BioY [Coriobacteriia bacterium]|nr:biotin transporter BioY [Coriobacteriia bacterium]